MPRRKRQDQSRQASAPNVVGNQSGQVERSPSYSKRIHSTCFFSERLGGASQGLCDRISTPLKYHSFTFNLSILSLRASRSESESNSSRWLRRVRPAVSVECPDTK